MVDVPTETEFEAALDVIEADIADLRARVSALEPHIPPGAPAISGVATADRTTTAATLVAQVDPQGQPFTWQYEYGTSTSYGSVSPAAPAAGTAAAQTVQTQISGLTSGAVYHFRLVVTSAAGTSTSGNETFIANTGSTGPAPTVPSVTSVAASSVINTSAVLSAQVSPNGSTTAWRFEYGLTTSYGGLAPIPDGSVATGAAMTVSATVTGLAAGTTYHYRLRAVNSSGTTTSSDRTFTTTATAPAIGRITRSGKALQLNGGQYKFAGMSWPHAVGCGPAGSQPTPAQAAQFFAELNPRSMTRIWVMPGMSLTAYDTVFAAAKAAGQYLCVTLLNGSSSCTSYTPTYTTPLDSTAAAWIDSVCTRHANEATVAMYEICNEANEANSNIAGWYQAVATRIKQRDPQALVGTGGGSAASNAGVIAAFAAGSAIDLISYHDVYAPAGTLGPRAAAFTTAANTANKPWYMGSRSFAGTGGDTGSLTTNAQRLSTEYGQYLGQANCSGYLYDNFSVATTGTTVANFGNALWSAARNYNNSAYNGSGGGGGPTTPVTGWWPYAGSYNHNRIQATYDWQANMGGGRPIGHCLCYQIRGSGWGSLLNVGGYPFDQFNDKSKTLIMQHAPFPSNVGANYAQLVAGNYDSYWRNFALALKAREEAGYPAVINSIAWEMNGTYFYWGGQDSSHTGGGRFTSNAQYIAGYQRIVNVMREVYPNVVTAWVINGHASNPQSNSSLVYPGDDYCTFIGGDWYNWYDGNPQSESAFRSEANDPDGILWMLARVRAAGPDWRGRPKKLIVPEWGLAQGYGTPGDNANWVTWMTNVFKEAHATGHMGPENYFNEAVGSIFDIYGSKPNARARYKSIYTPA
ncbi:glycosyl hydrolase [Glutamicibacter sp. V16R2B1]|uniref:glycosyl hydrolase n=1 Tax=Glutamicibacter sp. V16R2B1 TaxID=2036207 RepID=UPI0010FF0888|nr:glycosyl hydrolase [Glutamicibacter sp. V16R2B1]MCK9901279.1 hypothetical protein [Frankia sp. Cpl3]TLK47407.1 hypothetical protein FDN03_15825 [Glutamicibacter sp. V16R2B1]